MGLFFAVAFFLTASGCAFAQSPEDAKAIGAANAAIARLYHEGKNAEALTLALQTVERAEKELGEEHRQTLATVNNLALLYRAAGRYREAELLLKHAFEVSERVLGAGDHQTLGSVNNLAALYRAQGRYGEAEPLFKRALEARERALGKEHPDRPLEAAVRNRLQTTASCIARSEVVPEIRTGR